jgi:hypothetical protein
MKAEHLGHQNLEKPEGRHDDQYLERGLYPGFGFFSYPTRPIFPVTAADPKPGT